MRGTTQGTTLQQTEETGYAFLELGKSKQVTGTESLQLGEKSAESVKILGVFGACGFKKGGGTVMDCEIQT